MSANTQNEMVDYESDELLSITIKMTPAQYHQFAFFTERGGALYEAFAEFIELERVVERYELPPGGLVIFERGGQRKQALFVSPPHTHFMPACIDEGV